MRRGAWLGLALVIALVVAGPAGAAQPCVDCLQAGAARVALRVPTGVPLAGYGGLARRLLLPDVLGQYPHAFWFEPSRGERDTLAVRAIVLEASGRRVAWVSLDLLAVEARLTAEVAKRLQAAGTQPLTLILSASHTHSGPGAYIDSAVLGWLALDRFDRDVRAAVVAATVAAIREADAARRPARLATASVAVPGVAKSRLGQPLDEAMFVLRVSHAGGAPIALVWNFAIHGTTLGARNLRLSGDVMGEASTRLERALGVPVLFVNGAVGDVSPARHGEGATTGVGEALATAARQGWATAVPVERATLSVGETTVALPGPSLSIHNCLGGWWPRPLPLPLGTVFPRETTLGAVVIGDLGWVTFPGELQTALGLGIKRAAGLGHAVVAGLSNDYLGYFLAAADYARPTYVSCGSLYGPRTGECLAEAAGALLRAVGRGEASSGGRTGCDLGTAAR